MASHGGDKCRSVGETGDKSDPSFFQTPEMGTAGNHSSPPGSHCYKQIVNARFAKNMVAGCIQ